MIGRTQLSEVEEHLTGESARENETAAISLQNFIDEAEIRRVVDEIDNACDAKDWAKCHSFFAEEVDVDFTSLAGGEPARMKSEDLIDAWRKNLFAEKKTFHQRGNHRITITGENAQVFSKAYAFNLLETGEVTGLWEVWADYTHTLENGENGWKCAGMTLNVTHTRGDSRVRTFTPES